MSKVRNYGTTNTIHLNAFSKLRKRPLTDDVDRYSHAKSYLLIHRSIDLVDITFLEYSKALKDNHSFTTFSLESFQNQGINFNALGQFLDYHFAVCDNMHFHKPDLGKNGKRVSRIKITRNNSSSEISGKAKFYL